MNPRLISVLLAILVVMVPVAAYPHKPSDSYLQLTVVDHTILIQWDIALRDLDFVIGLDENSDGAITWGEVRSRHSAIAAYALSRLTIASQHARCWNQVNQHLIDHHSDGAYTVLMMAARCPSIPTALTIDYQLLFDVDPLHRGLLRAQHRGMTHAGVFGPDNAQLQIDLQGENRWREFLEFTDEGMWHIWVGYDHLLFLLSLLLPAVLWWKEGQWEAVASFSHAFTETLKIITSFTVAHSVTLSLSALRLITLPSDWVEPVIAGSVLLAALHNIYPVAAIRRWMVAFAFGLVHGFGFASVLTDLLLPTSSMVVALAGFNVGVEVGQIVLVSLFLPIAYVLRHSWAYRVIGVQVGSLAIVCLASIWILERSLHLSITPLLW